MVSTSALLGSTLSNSHLADQSDPCQHPGRSPDDYDQDDDAEGSRQEKADILRSG